MSDWQKYMNDPCIIDEPTALREVHAIRLAHYEETKHMTPEEHTRHVHEQVQKIIDEYGLKIKCLEPKTPARFG
ncbi:MAG: hypothetical protein LBQ73_08730 [Tannerellaceae bacterium]|jgi:hypothetical protein|nr:hypothetical protein [Tannerellaceae bacterium]